MATIEDADFSKHLYKLTMDDVKKINPKIRPSDARVSVTSSTNFHGYRWMTFEYDGIHTEGYYANAWENKIKGWEAWMNREEYRAAEQRLQDELSKHREGKDR